MLTFPPASALQPRVVLTGRPIPGGLHFFLPPQGLCTCSCCSLGSLLLLPIYSLLISFHSPCIRSKGSHPSSFPAASHWALGVSFMPFTMCKGKGTLIPLFCDCGTFGL